MLAWDIGALFILAPFKADLIDHMEFDIPVEDDTKVKKVRCIGTTVYKLKSIRLNYIYLPFLLYHLTTSDIQWFIF